MSRISRSVSGYTGAESPPPHRLMAGMITSAESSPPATMTLAMRMPRMEPPPVSGGEAATAGPALYPTPISNPPRISLRPSVISLTAMPTPMPQNTPAAWRPPTSAATSTSAEAMPSGYGSLPCSPLMRYSRSGTMNSTPMMPPAIASRVIWAHSGLIPQMNSAGMVNSTPDATDDDAEPTVWEMLLSRMVWETPNAWSSRNTTTVSTAIGIDVLMVRPALRPR